MARPEAGPWREVVDLRLRFLAVEAGERGPLFSGLLGAGSLGGVPLPRAEVTARYAEDFVVSEMAAATGASTAFARQKLTAAIALFVDDRLPRTRVLLAAGLLDWSKVSVLVRGTADVDPEVVAVVEGRLIGDGDVAAAEAWGRPQAAGGVAIAVDDPCPF